MDLLFDEEDAGAFAREMLLHVCGFNPEGPNSLEYRWGDEPGLCYARILPEIYDWTYDRYTEKERTYVEKTLVRYAEMTYERLLEVDFTKDPTRSHPARLPGFLGQQVLLLHHRLPNAQQMLQHALDVFNTVYPHWGGGDGGWAEGPNYSTPYNSLYFPFFLAFERQTGFSFRDRPFYRRISDFWLHTIPPKAEDMPFGDGHDAGPRTDPDEVTSRLVSEFVHPPVEASHDPGELDVAQSKLFGDAAGAYGDALERFDRHVLFVRPVLFLVYDDLAAGEPIPFTWLLHSHERPDIDQDGNTIELGRGDATMATELYAPTDLALRHTDEYATPVNEGMMEELQNAVQFDPPFPNVHRGGTVLSPGEQVAVGRERRFPDRFREHGESLETPVAVSLDVPEAEAGDDRQVLQQCDGTDVRGVLRAHHELPLDLAEQLELEVVDAVVFENAYTPAPACVPARQCLMIGELPRTCGCEAFGGTPGHDRMQGWAKRYGEHGPGEAYDVEAKFLDPFYDLATPDVPAMLKVGPQPAPLPLRRRGGTVRVP
jgi:hypothetical protein